MLALALSWMQEGSHQPRSLNTLLEFAPGASLWTLIAFAVALPLMWKLVYGPITRGLEARDRKVDDAIAAAESARKEAEQQVATARAELDKARAEARTMVDAALQRAEKQAQEALAAAQAEGKAQLQRAREEIEGEKRAALEEVRQHVVALTIQATGALLKQKVDDQAHQNMVREFVAAAEKERR